MGVSYDGGNGSGESSGSRIEEMKKAKDFLDEAYTKLAIGQNAKQIIDNAEATKKEAADALKDAEAKSAGMLSDAARTVTEANAKSEKLLTDANEQALAIVNAAQTAADADRKRNKEELRLFREQNDAALLHLEGNKLASENALEAIEILKLEAKNLHFEAEELKVGLANSKELYDNEVRRMKQLKDTIKNAISDAFEKSSKSEGGGESAGGIKI